MHSGHSVVKTRGPSEGKFTFTSVDAGDHSICLSTNYTAGLFQANTHIRLYLDVVVGAARHDPEHDRNHVNDLSTKLRDLNMKLEDVRREQRYQREREAAFRDLSEATNSRAVWYSVAQIVIIIATCTWQLRHLRVCPTSLHLLRVRLTCPATAFLRGPEDEMTARPFLLFLRTACSVQP